MLWLNYKFECNAANRVTHTTDDFAEFKIVLLNSLNDSDRLEIFIGNINKT
jgi:hypothetical protein